MSVVVLAGFFRSGTSHRVRIALNLKGIPYRYEAVSLPKREHRSVPFLAMNPQGLVPVLKVDGEPLLQSPAIIEWLDETYPDPPLLPATVAERARVRAIAAMIGCDIHPVNNLRILNELRSRFGADEAQVAAWARHWITEGFAALEAYVSADVGRDGFCIGHQPTLADCYLIPQVTSARRFGVDLEPYPTIREIDANCAALRAFADARPDQQPDAV
jgi:maleylpyruvate isomerase